MIEPMVPWSVTCLAVPPHRKKGIRRPPTGGIVILAPSIRQSSIVAEYSEQFHARQFFSSTFRKVHWVV